MEVISNLPQRKVATDKEDSDWDADTHTPAELQQKETLIDTLAEPPVESPWDYALVEASVGLVSKYVVQIHAGSDDLD